MIRLDGMSLTLEEMGRVVDGEAVELCPLALERVKKCRHYVEDIIAQKRTVYGLTTGFGKFAQVRIEPEHLEELQENLILSHSVGTGPKLESGLVRAIMLLRVNMLAKGNSGIRPQTLDLLIEMLNRGVHPVIPEKGSVGASGDLAPLSHLVMVMLGMGTAEFKGEIMSGMQALLAAGLGPIRLAAKEGLALNNGTQFMTALGAVALLQAENLYRNADLAAALSTDALLGTPVAFDKLIHQLRPHPGQMQSAANLTALLADSPLRASHLDCDRVQDPYSLRCTPQVHGAVRDSLAHVRAVLERELNAVTDNPLIFPDEDRVISGGNFHGEPVALALDYLSMAAGELATISERRVEQMLNPALNRGLPAFLATRPGLDSGLMIAQLTAASLIAENQVLQHPASVFSLPTSANQEDHVSMGATSALKALKVIDNVTWVLGLEVLASCQALDDRDVKTSPRLEEAKALVRERIAHITRDRFLQPDLEAAKELVKSGSLARGIN